MTSDMPTEGDPTDHIAVAVNANPVLLNKDDDGLALDEYFEAMNDTPIADAYVATEEVRLPATTRILVSKWDTRSADPNNMQQMMFPADPNRQALYVRVVLQEGFQADFNIVSEPTGSIGGVGAFTGTGGTAPAFSFENHTGAVYIVHTGGAATYWVTSVTV